MVEAPIAMGVLHQLLSGSSEGHRRCRWIGSERIPAQRLCVCVPILTWG
jgi:hypothetical protein